MELKLCIGRSLPTITLSNFKRSKKLIINLSKTHLQSVTAFYCQEISSDIHEDCFITNCNCNHNYTYSVLFDKAPYK